MALLRRVLGDTLRGQRIRQRRTLRDVSSEARVSLGYLSEIERGQKEASSELLSAICEALGVRLSEVMYEVTESLRQDEAPRRTIPATPLPLPRELVGAGAGTTHSGGPGPGPVPEMGGDMGDVPDFVPEEVGVGVESDRDQPVRESATADHPLTDRMTVPQAPTARLATPAAGAGPLGQRIGQLAPDQHDEFTIDPVVFDAELATVTGSCVRAVAGV